MTFSFESVEPSGGILIRKRFYVPLVIAGIDSVAPAFGQTSENVRAGQSLVEMSTDTTRTARAP
jgi:hypothetical protein